MNMSINGALAEVAAVLQHGDDKHGKNAWRRPDPQGDLSKQHVEGANRHIIKRLNGQEREEDDSGLRHLAHAAARAIIALQLEIDRENGHT